MALANVMNPCCVYFEHCMDDAGLNLLTYTVYYTHISKLSNTRYNLQLLNFSMFLHIFQSCFYGVLSRAVDAIPLVPRNELPVIRLFSGWNLRVVPSKCMRAPRILRSSLIDLFS